MIICIVVLFMVCVGLYIVDMMLGWGVYWVFVNNWVFGILIVFKILDFKGCLLGFECWFELIVVVEVGFGVENCCVEIFWEWGIWVLNFFYGLDILDIYDYYCCYVSC